jgi:hypothetical protein
VTGVADRIDRAARCCDDRRKFQPPPGHQSVKLPENTSSGWWRSYRGGYVTVLRHRLLDDPVEIVKELDNRYPV